MYHLTDDQLTIIAKEDYTAAYIFGTISLSVATCAFGASSAAHGAWFGAFITAGVLCSIFASFFLIQVFWKSSNLSRRIDEIRGISSSGSFRLRLPWTFD